MENIYFVHNASTGKLFVCKLPPFTDIDEAVKAQAEYEGMHWGDCDWGGVTSIKMEV